MTRLASDYSSGYSFRAESYFGLQQYDKAIDDVIKALDIDGDNKAFHLMQQVADSAMIPLVAKLKVQSAKIPIMNIGSIVWELYTNVLMLIKRPLNIIQVAIIKMLPM